jgi:hypothetical protein
MIHDLDINSMYSTNLCQEIVLTKPRPVTLTELSFDFNYSFWDKPKKVKQYKFSRAKWYEAKLPRDRQGAYSWCMENFGAEPSYPDAWSRWYLNVDKTFRFRDAKDYEWFLLRWGT